MKRTIPTLAIAAIASTAMLFGSTETADAGDVRFSVRVGNYHSRDHRPPRCEPPVYHRGRRDHYDHRGHVSQRRKWIDGCYVSKPTRVCVRAGYHERVYVPPVYGTYYDRCGNARRYVVRPGCYKTVYHPPVYETRHTRVWVDGHYQVY